ncbi:sensor domain-containing diguanylate cyclase [Fusibacter bizertensis]
MAKFMWRPKSIVSRLTSLVLIIILFQTVLLAGTLIFGGVFDQAEKNAYQAFYDKVNNRKEYVQREMKNRWTNLDPYVSTMEKSIASDMFDSDLIFSEMMDQLIAMLRTTQVTGAYIILNHEDINSNRYPALYIRDYDPLSNIYSDDDIYMISGPSDLAKEYKIPLDQTWQYHLKLTADNDSFFINPYTYAALTSKASLLGYWSKPFRLSESDVPIITYSMPLFDNSGKLRGIVGIEVTLNYLTDFFPATDLQPRDSLGYLIAYRKDGNEEMMPVVMEGALQKRMILEDEPLKLKSLDTNRNIYELMNHEGKEVIYASVEKIGLYQYNTPFEDEQWYIVGFMREDYLLSYVKRIQQILTISLLLSIVLGAVGGSIISYQVSKPIINLAKEVKETDKTKILHLSSTGLLELDELSHAIEVANKLMLDSASRLSKIIEMVALPIGAFEMNKSNGNVFVTEQFFEILGYESAQTETFKNKDAFKALLDNLFSAPEPDEENVYRINTNPIRWIRINVTIVNDLVIGVIMNVTDEILDKNEIKRDRDLDSLTKLLNRKGFQWRFEAWEKSKTTNTVAALLMFDLDNLKIINDTYGHKWGDQYIIKAVERLQSIADTEHQILGRRSGDEFVLLLHGFESKAALRENVIQFFKALKDHLIEFPDGSRKPVMISGGLMWYEHPELSYEELLHYADEALYESKRHKKGDFTESLY